MDEKRRAGSARRVRSKAIPEIGVSVGITLVCFFLFLGLLSVTFRKGSSLQELMRDRPTLEGWTSAERDSRLEITAGGRAPDAVVALLTSAHNNVKDKPATGLAWHASRAGTPLQNHHSVQTFDRSQAVINFDPRNELRMGENALVVIKSLRESSSSGKKRSALMVMGGELLARLSNTSRDSVRVELETLSAARLHARDHGDEAVEVRVSVDESGTSTISVLEGSAEVEAGGATHEVTANEAVFVDKKGEVSKPQPLPDVPLLITPSDSVKVVYRDQSPRLEFSWSGAAAVYELTLARDPDLVDVVHRERLSGTGFVYGNLREGTYYWGVVAVEGRIKSGLITGGPIRVAQDRDPPPLAVAFPEAAVRSAELRLRGKSEPGADIYVDDRPAEASGDGSFEHLVQLSRGLNVIVVEAIDAAGNVTYKSGTVMARY